MTIAMKAAAGVAATALVYFSQDNAKDKIASGESTVNDELREGLIYEGLGGFAGGVGLAIKSPILIAVGAALLANGLGHTIGGALTARSAADAVQ